MATLFITGNGTDSFVKKIMELNSEIESLNGTIIHIPEGTMLNKQEYLTMLKSLSADEDVQITKLYC